MLKNQKIRFRILSGYAVSLLLFVLVALAVYASLTSHEKANRQTDQSLVTFTRSNEMDLLAAHLQLNARGYILFKNDHSRINYDDNKKRFEEVSRFLSTIIKDEKQRDLYDRLIPKYREIINNFDGLISLVNKGRTAEAIEEFRNKNMVNQDAELRKLNIEFDRREMLLLETAKKTQAEALGYIGRTLMIGIVLSLVILSILGLLTTKWITKRVADAINSMSTTTTEIAATVSQHERTAVQQASMVNETATTIQELSASSKQTSEQAMTVTEVAQKALSATVEGAIIVKQAIEGMNTLESKVGMIADQILKLGEQTAQLGNLANMIKDFSGEINMLALNAAVEAARAGEHGKGFAVVAGEIRKLANESKKSAEQANTVISDIQKATNATILRTEEGKTVVDEVMTLAGNVGGLFTTVSDAANNAYENAQQVLLNAKQQALAIGQVMEAMNGLNAGARETASGIIQTKTGIEQIKSATMNLMQII